MWRAAAQPRYVSSFFFGPRGRTLSPPWHQSSHAWHSHYVLLDEPPPCRGVGWGGDSCDSDCLCVSSLKDKEERRERWKLDDDGEDEEGEELNEGRDPSLSLPDRDPSGGGGCCVAAGTFPLERGITPSRASCLFLTLLLKG